MTKQQEVVIDSYLEDLMKESRFQGMKAGAYSILSVILDMCDEGKTVEDIRSYCIQSLSQEGMKVKRQIQRQMK